MKTTYEIAKEIADEVAATRYGTADLQGTEDGWSLRLTTGGWSDAEEIINQLEVCPADGGSQEPWLWRILTWQTIERGGRFTFSDDKKRVVTSSTFQVFPGDTFKTPGLKYIGEV